jgi:CheY-like chemotaxis protein
MTINVLIVDDSKLARLTVSKALAVLRADWTTVEFSNAEDALAVMQKKPADLAIIDYNMPKRDGLTLAAEIRKLRPTMPLAILSANYQSEILDGAMNLGARFLPKPLNPKDLQSFLHFAEASLK